MLVMVWDLPVPGGPCTTSPRALRASRTARAWHGSAMVTLRSSAMARALEDRSGDAIDAVVFHERDTDVEEAADRPLGRFAGQHGLGVADQALVGERKEPEHGGAEQARLLAGDLVGPRNRAERIDVNIDGTATIEIYYRPGTYVGHENSATGWTLAASVPNVVSNGANVPTPVPTALSINIPQGHT